MMGVSSQGTDDQTSLGSNLLKSEYGEKAGHNVENDKILSEIFNEETNMVSSIGDEFIKKMQYVDIYKTKVQLEDRESQSDEDSEMEISPQRPGSPSKTTAVPTALNSISNDVLLNTIRSSTQDISFLN